MSEPHNPIEGLLDRLVYAPLGLVTDARTVVPQLAERGRLQVANAKMMGRFAVQMGSVEAAKRVGGLEGHLREALVGFGFLPPELTIGAEPVVATPEPEPVKLTPAKTSVTARKARPKSAPVARKATAKPKTKAAAKPAAVPAADDLGIPGYDSLAASQVVSRLAGLRPAELTAVQRYEVHHRGRKTILGRIAQLQAS